MQLIQTLTDYWKEKRRDRKVSEVMERIRGDCADFAASWKFFKSAEAESASTGPQGKGILSKKQHGVKSQGFVRF